jgi:hypothetical protein
MRICEHIIQGSSRTYTFPATAGCAPKTPKANTCGAVLRFSRGMVSMGCRLSQVDMYKRSKKANAYLKKFLAHSSSCSRGGSEERGIACLCGDPEHGAKKSGGGLSWVVGVEERALPEDMG